MPPSPTARDIPCLCQRCYPSQAKNIGNQEQLCEVNSIKHGSESYHGFAREDREACKCKAQCDRPSHANIWKQVGNSYLCKTGKLSLYALYVLNGNTTIHTDCSTFISILFQEKEKPKPSTANARDTENRFNLVDEKRIASKDAGLS